jgi:hypothetical protein
LIIFSFIMTKGEIKMAEKSVQKETSVSQLGVGKLRPGTIQITLADEVKLEDLHSVIDRIVNLNGCRACGLGGIDVIFRGVDPVIYQRFADIPAVRDVTLIR